jgi:hypothetical protein
MSLQGKGREMPAWVPEAAIKLAADLSTILSFPLVAVPILLIAGALHVAKNPPEGGIRAAWDRLAYRKTVVVMLIIGLVAYGTDIADRIYNRQVDFDANAKLEQVFNRSYQNEIIHLDGKELINCTFDNVTFLYQGSSPFLLAEPHFPSGTHVRFGSANPALNLAIRMSIAIAQNSQALSYKIVPQDEVR